MRALIKLKVHLQARVLLKCYTSIFTTKRIKKAPCKIEMQGAFLYQYYYYFTSQISFVMSNSWKL